MQESKEEVKIVKSLVKSIQSPVHSQYFIAKILEKPG